jgi:WD40 repeat protein
VAHLDYNPRVPITQLHDAFICYSRRDRAYAARLEAALESYKPPPELRTSRRRLTVFRDEGDFSGIEYETAIDRHLRGSAKLIVICSPHARSSAYVADEIRRFASFNGAANIVPVLVDGVPNNEAASEADAARMAFPDVLCDLLKMPIATDYRGWDPHTTKIDRGPFEQEWYKTLANLLDDEPAVVEQRERKRRARFLRVALAGSAVVIALLTGTLILTLLSRREAIFQREQVRRTAAQADFDLAMLYRRGATTVDPRTLVHLARALRTRPDAELPRQYLVSLLRDVPWYLPLSEPLRHDAEVLSAAFSPDGSRVLTASRDGTARLWNSESGAPIGNPMRHDGPVMAAVFSPDGSRVLSRAEDGTARIWSTATAEPIGDVLRHEGPIFTAAFSPNGRWIVTGGSLDQSARVWEAESGRPVGQPLRHRGGVGIARFSPDNARLFTGSLAGIAQFWDVASGRPIGHPVNFGIGVEIEALSPDGRRILTQRGFERSVHLVDAQTGKPIDGAIDRAQLTSPATFSADGSAILAASADGTARIWNARTGEAIGNPLRPDGRLLAVAFSPDGAHVATASDDKTARVWDARTGEPIGEPLSHDDRVFTAAFSPDGRRIVTASADRSAQVWSVEGSSQRPLVLAHRAHVMAAQFSSNPVDRLLTATSDGFVHAWAVDTGQLLSERRHPLAEFTDDVSVIGFSPDGRRVVAAFNNTARAWDLDTGRWIGHPLPHEKTLTSVSFSPDGALVITASADGMARLWDVDSGTRIGELRHDLGVAQAAFSPDARWIVTTLEPDNTAGIWNARTGQLFHGPLRHASDRGVLGALRAAFSADGKQLVTACMDGTVQVWNVESGQPAGDLLRHDQDPREQVFAAAVAVFSPDGRRIASVAGDGTARIWDAATGSPLSVPLTHGAQVEDVAFSGDGRRVATTSETAAIVWDVAVDTASALPAWVPDLAEALAGKRFDDTGVLVPPAKSLVRLRDELRASTDQAFWHRLARWFFTRGPDRARSPIAAAWRFPSTHRTQRVMEADSMISASLAFSSVESRTFENNGKLLNAVLRSRSRWIELREFGGAARI